MSQENVELVRRGIEAWNRGDMDAMLATLHPEVEYVTGVFPGLDRVYRGHDGFRKFWQDFVETWESLSIETHELRDCGARVLVLFTSSVRGRDGLEVRRQMASVATFRDGLDVRHENYLDWTTALQAVGLRDSAVSQANMELVRANYRAWTDGDVDALLDTLDPEIEFRPSGVFPDFAPIYRGHDGMRTFWDEMRAPWEWFHLDAERIVEGEDCAAVALHFRARGKGSGVITDLQQGHAVWFRHGRIVKASAHTSFEEALAAVGLRE